MFAANVEYYRASSVDEALKLLSSHPGAKLLAGGHGLIPLMKLRLSDAPALVDIGRIQKLKGIERRDGVVSIGALTVHADLASSEVLRDACPIIAEAAAMIGDPQVRNRGTVGGNVAHADPASDLPSVLTALGARFHAVGPGGNRTIEASDFFQDLMSTALADDEVLTSVEVPAARPGQGMAYSKFFHPASRYSVVSAAVVVTVSGGTCSSASVALGGLLPRPERALSVERALVGKALSDDTIANAAGQVSNDLGDDVLGDIFASAEYRRAMAPIYVKRALSSAAQRAG